VPTRQREHGARSTSHLRLSDGGFGLLPASSRRLVQTVRCPFPVMHVARANVSREVPVVIEPAPAPSQTKKTGEVKALRRRVPNNRFASVVRPSYLTSVCQWPRRSLVRRIGIPRPRPRSRSVAAGRFGFPLASASSSSADGQQHIRCDSLIAMAMPCAPRSCRTGHHPRCAAIRRSVARSKHAQ